MALQRHSRGLGALVCSRILGEDLEGSSSTTNDNNDDQSVDKFLQAFEQALKQLPRLSNFSHEPAHLDDFWGTRWRRLRFNIYGVLAESYTDEDIHIDALQLFLCLRTLALARGDGHGGIRSTHMYTGGTAFWRPRDLVLLLRRWSRDGASSSRLGEDGSTISPAMRV